MNRTLKLACIFIAAVLVLAVVPLLTFSGITGADTSAAADNSPANATAGPTSVGERLKKAIILYVGSPKAYINGNETLINPADPEVTPVIKDNIRMVPLRFIAESFGAKVDWEQGTRMVAVTIGDKTYKFKQGSNILMVGDAQYELDIPVQTVKDKTFVPLGRLVEILGKKAFYDRGLIIISDTDNIVDPVSDRAAISELVSKLSYLPVVGSYEKLVGLLEDAQKDGNRFYGARNSRKAVMNEAEAMDNTNSGTAEAKMKESAAGDGLSDYSTTNVQVQGVDEADIVKTDGEYIYQVNRQRVIVARAYPAENMKVLSFLNYDDGTFEPLELYLHDEKLIVIGASRFNMPVFEKKDGVTTEIYPAPQHWQSAVKAMIYDMADRENIKLLREVEMEGSYVSSRKIGSSLYMVANDYADLYRIQNDEAGATPSYRDTLEKDGYVKLDYNAICYFPGFIEPSYMLIAGIDLDGNEAATVSAYLGAGQNIYASLENLYVAVTGYRAGGVKPLPEVSGGSGVSADGKIVSEDEESTLLYKFGLKEAKVTYLCKGEVPGTILNQFSMDEAAGGAFRIATTRGDIWRTDERTSKNNLYVLDDTLSITGKIEDLAPGEKIYSVRFMGDRAYVVTFKTVDPLFVIDLKDPAKPAVLGALKIPGYSDYLHPYDENHIIGFGKDAVESKGQAYYLGMKIALFDVTDVSRPVQKFSEVIGDRGTDSPLLRDHKALLFSKEKNLLAFPVTVMEAGGVTDAEKRKSLQYGEFTFQGAYIYSLNLIDGFKLRGKITHLSDEDYRKAGSGWYESDKNIQRLLYIEDTLYTLSNSVLKANGLQDLKDKGSIVIP